MPPVYDADAHPSRIGWRLPPFYCPFERELIHPKAAELEERAVAWIDSYGLYPNATERAWGLATRSAEFTSRIIPYGDVEPMLLFTQWNYWAFATDDWQDSDHSLAARTAAVADHGARLVRTVETPGAGLLPPGPHTDALEDLVARTRAVLTPSSFAASPRASGTGSSARPARRPTRSGRNARPQRLRGDADGGERHPVHPHLVRCGERHRRAGRRAVLSARPGAHRRGRVHRQL